MSQDGRIAADSRCMADSAAHAPIPSSVRCPACVAVIPTRRDQRHQRALHVRCPACLAAWDFVAESRVVHQLAMVLRQGHGIASILIMIACAAGGFVGTPGAAGMHAVGGALVFACACALVLYGIFAVATSRRQRLRLRASAVPARRLLARLARELDDQVYTDLAARSSEERRMRGVAGIEQRWLLGQRQLDAARSIPELLDELSRYVDFVEHAITSEAVDSGRLNRTTLDELVSFRRHQFACGELEGPRIPRMRA